MEFNINVTGTTEVLEDHAAGNVTVSFDGNGDAIIAGTAALIMDIAFELEETVEDVITEIYTVIKQKGVTDNGCE